MLNPGFITCHNMGQERFPFLIVMCFQLQMKSLAVTFVFWLYLSRNPFPMHLKGMQDADSRGNAWRIQVAGMWQAKMCASKRKCFVDEVVLDWNAIVFDLYMFTVFVLWTVPVPSSHFSFCVLGLNLRNIFFWFGLNVLWQFILCYVKLSYKGEETNGMHVPLPGGFAVKHMKQYMLCRFWMPSSESFFVCEYISQMFGINFLAPVMSLHTTFNFHPDFCLSTKHLCIMEKSAMILHWCAYVIG